MGKKKYTTEYIISLFKNTHKDKYDYSKVNYIDSQTKVCVICPEHGEFWILSSHHIKGVNCPKCMGNAKYTTNSWISKAKEISKNLENSDLNRHIAEGNEKSEAAISENRNLGANIVGILKDLDINKVTPLSAFEILADLIEKVK